MPEQSNTLACKLCGDIFTDLKSCTIHLETESHRLKKLETAAQSENPLPESLPAIRSHERLVDALYCLICDVRTSSEEPMLDHFKSKKHKKYLHYHADLKKHVDRRDFEMRYVLLLEEVELKKRGIFKCSLCSVDFNKKRSLYHHLKSEYHYQRRDIIRSKETVKIHQHDLLMTPDIESLLDI